MVVNWMVEFIVRTLRGVLSLTRRTMPIDRLALLADAVHRSGAPLTNCIGFIDGTVRAIARPNSDQREWYNGHKRKHALKYQGVMLAHGMFGNMFGPVV